MPLLPISTFCLSRYALCSLPHAPSSTFLPPSYLPIFSHSQPAPTTITSAIEKNVHDPGIPRRPSPGLRVCREPGTHAGRYRNRCSVEDRHTVFEAVSGFEPGFPMTAAVQKETGRPLSSLSPSCRRFVAEALQVRRIGYSKNRPWCI